MSERPSPLDALVDLLVYAPVGLAVTVTEEMPALVAKGRGTVGPQIGTARAIGQFVVAEGRRRLVHLVGFAPGSSAPADSAPETASGTPATGADVAPEVPVTETPASEEVPETPTRRVARPARPTGEATASDGPAAEGGSSEPAGPAPDAEGLAIPGYDSLSASQVVQRLAGLSVAELAAVGEYETATRGRRTILARISQLQGS